MADPFASFAPSNTSNPRGIRGRVTRVHKDATGTQYSFLFDVAPMGGGTVAGNGAELTNVILRTPGIGSLADPDVTPGCMLFYPEVGSVVHVERVGNLWAITGFYTGPVQTALETGLDRDSYAISFNPGIETDTSRRQGLPGWQLPHWSGGIEPGDILLSRGQQRVKLTKRGLYLGSDLDNCEIFALDGSRIRRYRDFEDRGIGLWHVLRSELGNPQITNAMAASAMFAERAPYAHVYLCRVLDVGPHLDQMRPYLVQQEGFVHRSQVNDGRTAPRSHPMASEAARALATNDYVVKHFAVAHPTSPTPAAVVGDEFESTDPPAYDEQIDVDGSFRVRAGNTAKTPGGQTKAPATQMDLSFDFDALTQQLTIRVGRGGTQGATIRLIGNDPASATVDVEAANVSVRARNAVTVQAASEVKVQATSISLEGQVSIKGNVNIAGQVTASGDLRCQGVSASKHTHAYTDDGSPAVTSIPSAT